MEAAAGSLWEPGKGMGDASGSGLGLGLGLEVRGAAGPELAGTPLPGAARPGLEAGAKARALHWLVAALLFGTSHPVGRTAPGQVSQVRTECCRTWAVG